MTASQTSYYLQILQSVVIILGVFAAIWVGWIRNKQRQLDNWEQLKNFIDSDTEIRRDIHEFLIYYRSTTLDDLIREFKVGERLYMSEKLQQFSRIGRHYEQLGSAVRRGYFPQRLVIDIIPFPHEFWDETKDLRCYVKQNWFGENDPLKEFWCNFEWLRDRLPGAYRIKN
jgi:hypothetical protein